MWCFGGAVEHFFEKMKKACLGVVDEILNLPSDVTRMIVEYLFIFCLDIEFLPFYHRSSNWSLSWHKGCLVFQNSRGTYSYKSGLWQPGSPSSSSRVTTRHIDGTWTLLAENNANGYGILYDPTLEGGLLSIYFPISNVTNVYGNIGPNIREAFLTSDGLLAVARSDAYGSRDILSIDSQCVTKFICRIDSLSWCLWNDLVVYQSAEHTFTFIDLHSQESWDEHNILDNRDMEFFTFISTPEILLVSNGHKMCRYTVSNSKRLKSPKKRRIEDCLRRLPAKEQNNARRFHPLHPPVPPPEAGRKSITHYFNSR